MTKAGASRRRLVILTAATVVGVIVAVAVVILLPERDTDGSDGYWAFGPLWFAAGYVVGRDRK